MDLSPSVFVFNFEDLELPFVSSCLAVFEEVFALVFLLSGLLFDLSTFFGSFVADISPLLDFYSTLRLPVFGLEMSLLDGCTF